MVQDWAVQLVLDDGVGTVWMVELVDVGDVYVGLGIVPPVPRPPPNMV